MKIGQKHGAENLQTQTRRDDKEDEEEELEDSFEDSDHGQNKPKPKVDSEEEQDSPKSPNLSDTSSFPPLPSATHSSSQATKTFPPSEAPTLPKIIPTDPPEVLSAVDTLKPVAENIETPMEQTMLTTPSSSHTKEINSSSGKAREGTEHLTENNTAIDTTNPVAEQMESPTKQTLQIIPSSSHTKEINSSSGKAREGTEHLTENNTANDTGPTKESEEPEESSEDETEKTEVPEKKESDSGDKQQTPELKTAAALARTTRKAKLQLQDEARFIMEEARQTPLKDNAKELELDSEPDEAPPLSEEIKLASIFVGQQPTTSKLKLPATKSSLMARPKSVRKQK